MRSDNSKAKGWRAKIKEWIEESHPGIKVTQKTPKAWLVLGGDGTILEAARKYHEQHPHPLVFGLNLGTVGFLASVREPKDFMYALGKFFEGKYTVKERLMLQIEVVRKGRSVFTAYALNDIVVQNPLGMVELEVAIEGYPFQTVRGTGVLVASATGSTAYNLSAHGPILMPEIKAMIVTELLDHSIPTPSLVVKYHNKITLTVKNFRERGILSITKTKKPVDVLAMADSEEMFALRQGDEITISKSPHLVNFAEIEKSYFFKSLHEKFSFD